MDHSATFDQLCKLNDQATHLVDQANEMFKGRMVRITSKFNGQPHGRSRRPLTGKILRIDVVYLNEYGKPSFYSSDSPDAGFTIEDCELCAPQS